MMGPRLRAENAGYTLGRKPILDDVSVDLGPGQSLAVTGPSGAGKTTLLMLMAGVLRPTQGRVLLDGIPVPSRSAGAPRIGLVLQNSGLVPDLTAAENVGLPLQARRLPSRLILERTEWALAAVGLDGLASRFADQLSGGQQQRVGLARALAGDPDVIIADEPTSELDAENRAIVVRLLMSEAARDKIVVVASHDLDVADACEAQIGLAGGRIAAAGQAAEARC